MSRPKKIETFEIGDKVKLLTDTKSEGVVVHRHSAIKDGKEWSVHWYNILKERSYRGVYSSFEIKKYY
jgi:hypothetical protein